MKIVSATLLAVSFLLALVFGAQTAEWSWGPAFLPLALALAAAAFGGGGGGGRWVAFSMLPAAGWIFYRGMTSDVWDFARADSMLVLAVLGPAFVVGGLRPGRQSLPLLFAGLAVVSILNLGIGFIQTQDPGFTWPYHQKPSDGVTGFFGHYNYFSCFAYTVGLLLAARGLFAKDHVALRVLFLATAVWSAAMVPMSGSRGGTLALVVGALVLLAGGAILAWRHGAWWAKVFLLLFPLVLVAAMAGAWALLARVQEDRGGEGLSRMMDNAGRLEWAELAMKVAMDHPVEGGGSRAYSWERNAHWEVGNFGRGSENERFVHNELLQLLTDYGVVGVVLVLIPIGLVGWLALSRLFLGGDEKDGGHLDALAVGVLAAGAAMLVQANFSFIFHLLPPAMLLGMLLGMGGLLASPRPATVTGLSLRAVGGGVLALTAGLIGERASRTLLRVWPVMYVETSGIITDPESAIGRMEMAAGSWSGHRMLEEAGHFSRIAATSGEDPEARRRWNRRAADFYRRAIPWHPHHPGLELNLANALSDLGEVQAAERAYLRAIELQGGLEAAFESRYFHARHLYSLWHGRWTDPAQRRAAEALWHFQKALAVLDEAKAQTLWDRQPQKELRQSLEQSIRFLEEARVTPRGPGDPVTE